MRNRININQKWAFSKEAAVIPETMPTRWIWVNLPHTWNGIDGQDGGGDYYRGTCLYAKKILKEELPEGEEHYLELCGANSSADVYWNGEKLAHHDGGYSVWRAALPETVKEENLLVIAVDNSPNDFVYPQNADFTFYGGLYRDVNLIGVPKTHFELEYYGTPGIRVTLLTEGEHAQVEAEVYLTGETEGKELCFTIKDREGNIVASKRLLAQENKTNFSLEHVQLWHGRKNPYLYTMEAVLLEDGKELDRVSTRFGCRSFSIDPEKGFFLNGESYPLHGVSRHQDRPEIGNALLPEHHREDMELICEVGANTIRLAHYQHDAYFYDLCDEKGMIVWAEIPYISEHLPKGRENTVSQMKELIIQNYNHPSIVVWGLSNEITMSGKPGEESDLLENHRLLNDLVHRMDPTRLTTIACVSMCDIHHPYIQIPDVISYNHYFGWYGGDVSMNGPWLDDFHKEFPGTPIGVSEYGCEALNWHSSKPEAGDYTEEYQAYYHEELIKQLFTRPYLWATHVWNMFDFAADARNEGGESGMNHKGLVTFDRKYKKDSFYAYKAWLSDEPFVHLCGKRYVDRAEEVTKVTVYSNQQEVELFANGKSLGKQKSEDHFFYYEVPNQGETVLVAKAGDCQDWSKIRKTDTFNEAYRMKEKGLVLNWFDITAPEGRYSLNDRIQEIQKSKEGNRLIDELFDKVMMKKTEGQEAEKEKSMSLSNSEGMKKMIGSFSVLRLLNMAEMFGNPQTKEQMLEWNQRLNQVTKEE